MELSGIATTRQWRPVGAITLTAIENLVKTSITIDPTIGSRSNFFDEFLEGVFNGVEWNRYDTATTSGRGHSTDGAREPGQKVHNYRSDRWIALKFLSRVFEGCFRWSCVESVRHAEASGRGHCTDSAREPSQMVHNYSSDRWIALKFLSLVFGGCFRCSGTESV